jgi:hypothetical protein
MSTVTSGNQAKSASLRAKILLLILALFLIAWALVAATLIPVPADHKLLARPNGINPFEGEQRYFLGLIAAAVAFAAPLLKILLEPDEHSSFRPYARVAYGALIVAIAFLVIGYAVRNINVSANQPMPIFLVGLDLYFDGPVTAIAFIVAIYALIRGLYLGISQMQVAKPDPNPQINRPKIQKKELRELERDIRSMIEHDNQLLNHRITWFLQINGFLFTAIAIFGSQPGRNVFGTIIGVTGICTCVSVGVALAVGRKAVHDLNSTWQNHLLDKEDEHFRDIGVFGALAGWKGIFGPWHILPYIFGFSWCFVIFFVWQYSTTRSNGSYSPVVINTKEQQVQILDSATGNLIPATARPQSSSSATP